MTYKFTMMNKLYQSLRSAIMPLATLLSSLVLTGCLGLSGGSELIPPEASGPAPTQVQVSTGTAPTYSWLVGNVSSVFVVRTDAPNNPVWGISAQGGAEIIPSPVVQGTITFSDPNLQLMSSAELTLTAGVNYRVCITAQGQTGIVLYCTTFIPPDGGGNPTATLGNSLAASTHSLALMRDGTAWAWGANQDGQIGDGGVTDTVTPLAIPGLSKVIAVASGGSHSLAVTADGTVWAWGANGYGQLGNGSNTDSAVPAQIPNLRGITAVAAGENHSLALGVDGTVWAWGENSSGQLGDGTTINRNTPAAVERLSNIVAIAAGKVHSMALSQDGTVWSWGGNYSGQLGDGTVANTSRPVRVER
jgi:Regulator of chromosome condensation (RCC1) repeat